MLQEHVPTSKILGKAAKARTSGAASTVSAGSAASVGKVTGIMALVTAKFKDGAEEKQKWGFLVTS